MKLLSIITINYNNLKGLEYTLKSVFEQTWKEFEYIVIDGGSIDGSRELIEENNSKITRWVSEADKGIYNAINKGIDLASGKYILCLNSGDVLYNKTVLQEVSLELQGGEDIIYGDTQTINYAFGDRLITSPKEVTFDFFVKHGLIHQSVFTKKKLHDLVGKYSEEYEIISDWIFFLESFKNEVSYKKIDKVVSIYDMTGISSINKEKVAIEKDLYIKQNYGFFIQSSNYEDPFQEKSRMTLKKMIKFILPYGIVRFLQGRKLEKN